MYGVYAKMIAPSFLVLAVLVQVSLPSLSSPSFLPSSTYASSFFFPVHQDPCFWVRLDFVRKLTQALHNNKLPPSYNVMLLLAAHDEAEVREMVSSYLFSPSPSFLSC